MAIPTYVGHGNPASGTGAVSPPLPSGIADGDVLFLHIEGEGEDTNADGAPSGGDWTLVASVASGTSGSNDKTRNTLYYHLYNGVDDPSNSVPDAGNHTLARISAFRGVDTSGDDPWHVLDSTVDASNTTSHSLTGPSTSVDDCLIVIFNTFGDNNGSADWVANNLADPSIAEQYDSGTNSGSDGRLNMAFGGLATAGAVGSVTFSCAASEERATHVVCLAPPASAKTGDADLAVAVTVSATGDVNYNRTATSNVAVAVAASGIARHKGTASSSISVSLADDTTHVTRKGSAASSVSASVAATPHAIRKGTASSAVAVSTASTPHVTRKGTAAVDVSVSSSDGESHVTRKGAAGMDVSVSVMAAGSVAGSFESTAALGVDVTVSATGHAIRKGTASANVSVSVSSAGEVVADEEVPAGGGQSAPFWVPTPFRQDLAPFLVRAVPKRSSLTSFVKKKKKGDHKHRFDKRYDN